MRRSTCIKLGFLAALGACSWLVTSSLLAQGRQRQAVRPATKVLLKRGQPPPALPGESVPVVLTGQGTFDEMTVTPRQGGATVDAQVTISDSRGDRSYMWALIVRGVTGGPHGRVGDIISSFDYDNQVFSVLPGRAARPTFKEDLPLLPGTYFVELRLYEVSPGMVPAELDKSHPLIPEVFLAHNETVTVER